MSIQDGFIEEVGNTRVALYLRLWAKGVTSVARDLGVGEHVIRSACKKYQIPLPDAAYWAARRRGQRPKKKRLLPWRVPTELELSKRPGYQRPTLKRLVEELRPRAVARVGQMMVPHDGGDHPLVIEERQRIMQQTSSALRLLERLGATRKFDVPDPVRRFTLATALYHALERCGYVVRAWPSLEDRAWNGTVSIESKDGAQIVFCRFLPSTCAVRVGFNAGGACERWHDQPGQPLETQMFSVAADIIARLMALAALPMALAIYERHLKRLRKKQMKMATATGEPAD